MDTDDTSKLGLAEKNKNLASPLAEFLLWFCPIRAANAAAPTQSPGGFSVIPAPQV